MVKIREMLCKIVTALELPANPLDQLTEMLGGAARVAEMTGRKGQLIRAEEGRVLYQHRRANVCPLGSRSYSPGFPTIIFVVQAQHSGL